MFDTHFQALLKLVNVHISHVDYYIIRGIQIFRTLVPLFLSFLQVSFRKPKQFPEVSDQRKLKKTPIFSASVLFHLTSLESNEFGRSPMASYSYRISWKYANWCERKEPLGGPRYGWEDIKDGCKWI